MLGGKLCDGKIADVQTATCNNTSLCSETLNNTNSTIDTDVLQAGSYSCLLHSTATYKSL